MASVPQVSASVKPAVQSDILEEFRLEQRAKDPTFDRRRREQRLAQRLAHRAAGGDLNAWMELLVLPNASRFKLRIPKLARTRLEARAAQEPFSRTRSLPDDELRGIAATASSTLVGSHNLMAAILELTRRAATKARELSDEELWRILPKGDRPGVDLSIVGALLEWKQRFGDHLRRGVLLVHYLK